MADWHPTAYRTHTLAEIQNKGEDLVCNERKKRQQAQQAELLEAQCFEKLYVGFSYFGC